MTDVLSPKDDSLLQQENTSFIEEKVAHVTGNEDEKASTENVQTPNEVSAHVTANEKSSNSTEANLSLSKTALENEKTDLLNNIDAFNDSDGDDDCDELIINEDQHEATDIPDEKTIHEDKQTFEQHKATDNVNEKMMKEDAQTSDQQESTNNPFEKTINKDEQSFGQQEATDTCNEITVNEDKQTFEKQVATNNCNEKTINKVEKTSDQQESTQEHSELSDVEMKNDTPSTSNSEEITSNPEISADVEAPSNTTKQENDKITDTTIVSVDKAPSIDITGEENVDVCSISESEVTDSSQDFTGIIKSDSDGENLKLKVRIGSLLPPSSRKNKRNVPRQSWEHLAKKKRNSNSFTEESIHLSPTTSTYVDIKPKVTNQKVSSKSEKVSSKSEGKKPKSGLRYDCPTFCKSGCKKTHHELLIQARRMIENDSATTMVFLNIVAEFYHVELGGTMAYSDCIDDPWKDTSFPLLHYLALMGKCAGSFALADAGHDPSICLAKNGDTVLHTMVREMYLFNCTHGHMDILLKKFILLLKEFKSCVFVSNNNKETCFHILGKLVKDTARICSDPGLKKPPFRLYQYQRNMFLSCLQIISDEDKDKLNLQDKEGCTVAHYIACDLASNDLLDMLKEKNCDFSIKNNNGHDVYENINAAPTPPPEGVLEMAKESEKGRKYKSRQSKSPKKPAKKRRLVEEENINPTSMVYQPSPTKASKKVTAPSNLKDVAVGPTLKIIESRVTISPSNGSNATLKMLAEKPSPQVVITSGLKKVVDNAKTVLVKTDKLAVLKPSDISKKVNLPIVSSLQKAIPTPSAVVNASVITDQIDKPVIKLSSLAKLKNITMSTTPANISPKPEQEVKHDTSQLQVKTSALNTSDIVRSTFSTSNNITALTSISTSVLPTTTSVTIQLPAVESSKKKQSRYSMPYHSTSNFSFTQEPSPSMVPDDRKINATQPNLLDPAYPHITNVQGSKGGKPLVILQPNFQPSVNQKQQQQQQLLQQQQQQHLQQQQQQRQQRPVSIPQISNHQSQQRPILFTTPDGRLMSLNVMQQEALQRMRIIDQRMPRPIAPRHVNQNSNLGQHVQGPHNPFMPRGQVYPRMINNSMEMSLIRTINHPYNQPVFQRQPNQMYTQQQQQRIDLPLHVNSTYQQSMNTYNQAPPNVNISPVNISPTGHLISPNYTSQVPVKKQMPSPVLINTRLPPPTRLSPPMEFSPPGMTSPLTPNAPKLIPADMKKQRSLEASIQNLHHSAVSKKSKEVLGLERILDEEAENAPPVIILENDEVQATSASPGKSSPLKHVEHNRIASLVKQYLEEKGSVADFLRFSNDKKKSLVTKLISSRSEINVLNNEILSHENEAKDIRDRIASKEMEIAQLRAKLNITVESVTKLRSKRSEVVDTCTSVEKRIKAVQDRTEIFQTLTTEKRIEHNDKDMLIRI